MSLGRSEARPLHRTPGASVSCPSFAPQSTSMSSPQILTNLRCLSLVLGRRLHYCKFSPTVSVRLRSWTRKPRCFHERASLKGDPLSATINRPPDTSAGLSRRVSARGKPVRPLVFSVRNFLFYDGPGCNCSFSLQRPPSKFPHPKLRPLHSSQVGLKSNQWVTPMFPVTPQGCDGESVSPRAPGNVSGSNQDQARD